MCTERPAIYALRSLAGGAEACITVTLLDGLVLSRSAFHHSMNYRSVMLFGTAEAVRDEDDKRSAVMAILEHLIPGRSAGTRAPTSEELRATLVVRLPIDEVSAKIRTGPPIEDEDDLGLAHWAGVLPLTLTPGAADTRRGGAGDARRSDPRARSGLVADRLGGRPWSPFTLDDSTTRIRAQARFFCCSNCSQFARSRLSLRESSTTLGRIVRILGKR